MSMLVALALSTAVMCGLMMLLLYAMFKTAAQYDMEIDRIAHELTREKAPAKQPEQSNVVSFPRMERDHNLGEQVD